jgi:hypothetical protein
MAGNQLGMPGGEQRDQTKFIVFENFEKMNTQSIRQSLSEKELAWLENLQPIAGNNLTTVPAPAAVALATISENISTMFYAALLGVDYFVAFTTAGSGYLINIATGAVGQFAPDGTFSAQPDVTTWQASRLLIADSKAGYSTFDGTIFVGQGGVSPNITVTNGGSGYGVAPSVTISGGSGTGATAHAVIQNGSVIQVVLDNPGHGYQVGDVLTVTFGTGTGSGATAHVTMTNFSVVSVQILSGGVFTTPSGTNLTLSFSGGGGTGARGYAVTASISGGSARHVIGVVVTSPGSGYTSPPTVSLSTGGTNPVFQSTLGTESLATIVLDTGGTGYTAANPSLSIVPSDGNGSGGAATATVAGAPTPGPVTAVALNASAVVTLFTAFQGISSTPGTFALSFSGGGGTGATGTATIGSYVNDSGTTTTGVISLNLTAGGTGYTTAPTVTVTGATFSTNPTLQAFTASQGAGYDLTPSVIIGSGTGAAASAHVWPFINSSIVGDAFTTLAVFQGRVWLGGGNLLTWTGTGASYGNVGYDDFLAADASGTLIISDADLIHAITALRAYNNYLFIMGDQSVKQIGNISLNQAGDVTLFTILTLSSDQGTIYPKSCISYNRVFMFANSNGIYGVFGSSVQKLSGDMDGIWKLVDFTQVPQGALADINAIHNAVFLVRYKDPLSTTRSIMLAFDGKRWFVLAQGNSLTAFATSASLATGQNSLYGSSGPDVTLLCARPTVAVAFKIQSSLTHHGDAVQGKRAIRAGFSSNLVAGPSSVTMTVDTEAALGPNRTMSVPTGFALVGGSNDANNLPINAAGAYLGITITGTLAGETMTNIICEYQEASLWKGA